MLFILVQCSPQATRVISTIKTCGYGANHWLIPWQDVWLAPMLPPILRKVEMKINVVMVTTRSCEQYIEDCRLEDLHYHKGLLQADVLDAKHRYESLKAQLDKMNRELGVTDGDDDQNQEQPQEPNNKKAKRQ